MEFVIRSLPDCVLFYKLAHDGDYIGIDADEGRIVIEANPTIKADQKI